ncbi:uncharacterized protein [Haliotis asinina]|uniref:uncharacterized protein n=1 Tax=Haliotis asinina TaxID=109174 RepID=UPI0035318485
MSRAPSIWYHYQDNFPGDIIQQSVCVPEDGATVDTYYCCMQWNAGLLGGGYCGIQDHPEGKAFIYSLWDPAQAKQPITAVYVGEGTKVSHFGGEGTGLHAFNVSLGWQTDNWYTLVSRVWPYKDHTYYGFWVHDESQKKWNHLVTMDFPYSNVQFSTSTGCFVEDWVGTGDNTRRAFYHSGFKRQIKGWYPFSVGTFSVIMEPPSAKHAHNYDAGTIDDYFYLASGGDITPTPGIGTSHTFYLSTPKEPKEPYIDFTITKASPSGVEWAVPSSSTPQFRFSVSVAGRTVASDIQPEVRSQALTGCDPGDVVTVTLEDIMGGCEARSVKISDVSCPCPRGMELSCSIV